jgi:hypothetical protein
VSILDAAGQAELDRFAARVRVEGQVDLGSFDESDLVALDVRPVPRIRLGHTGWPAYLDLPDGTDIRLAAMADHPRIRAARESLAARGLAEAGPSGSWRALGQARLVRLLSERASGTVGWFSTPAADRPDGLALNGIVVFSRWSPSVPGVCLVKSMTIRAVPQVDVALPTQIMACTPTIGARHLVAAVFREPLTPDERAQAPASRCGVVVNYVDSDTGGMAQSLFDFRHPWGAPTASSSVPGSRPQRRTLLGRRPESVDPGQLEAVLLKIVQTFVDRTEP